MRPPKVFEKLTEILRILPGVGRKSAERMAFYILSHQEKGKEIAEAVECLISEIVFCSICGNITVEDPCPICSSHERNSEKICVVEKPMDVFAIEKAGVYNGVYHVLGNLISPMDEINPEDIRINELKQRINDKIKEVIVAIKPTTEGEATSLYIKKILKPYSVKITRIAQGIPVGTDIDFADDITLLRAIEGRSEFRD